MTQVLFVDSQGVYWTKDSMELLVFAHRPEAYHFLEQDHWTSVPDLPFSLFKNQKQKQWLLITGEGLDKALISIASVLTWQNDINTVINLGVCGLLKDHSESLQQEEIYPLRTVYAEGFSGQLQHRSFTLKSAQKEGSYDCISASQRVLDENSSWNLSHHAPLVDREVWAVANVCDQFKIPFYSYKLISDIAGDSTACLDIRSQAQSYSEKLYHYYQSKHTLKAIAKKSIAPFPPLPESFHSTHSQKERLQKLLSSLQVQTQNVNDLLSQKMGEIDTQELSPKQKTNLLLQELQDQLSPFTRDLKKKLKALTEDIESHSIAIQFSQGFESENFQIQLKVNDAKKFQKDLESLKKLDVGTLQKTLLGEWE